MQSAESLKMQSVMLGGAADASAFMIDVGPFAYDALRAQEAATSPQITPRAQQLLPQLSMPQVSQFGQQQMVSIMCISLMQVAWPMTNAIHCQTCTALRLVSHDHMVNCVIAVSVMPMTDAM